MSDINTTPVRTGTTTAKKKITAKNLKLDDVVQLLRDIDFTIFRGDEKNLVIFNLHLCDIMVKWLKLHYYFPSEFEKIENFGEFFNDLFAGKFKDYLAAMNKTETSQLIDKAVETRKQIAIGRLQSPMAEILAKVNEILDTFAEEFKGIQPNDIKKFISDFANFAKENNPETLVDSLLKKQTDG